MTPADARTLPPLDPGPPPGAPLVIDLWGPPATVAAAVDPAGPATLDRAVVRWGAPARPAAERPVSTPWPPTRRVPAASAVTGASTTSPPSAPVASSPGPLEALAGAVPGPDATLPGTDRSPGRDRSAGRDRPVDGVLVGRHLERRFGDVIALAGVDLAVGRGEAVAAMGPSGSGKSTLLHCLAGIERPDRGEVWLGERRVDQLSERERSRMRAAELGFVFQSGQLLPELPAVENVALPLMLTGTPRRAAVAEAGRWFGPLGIEGLERRRPGELSGGQSQRVSIARALVGRPRAVFADEPTAALDRATGQEVVALLVRACRSSGAALLVVTHDPEVAAACDRTVHLRDGALVAEERNR